MAHTPKSQRKLVLSLERFKNYQRQEIITLFTKKTNSTNIKISEPNYCAAPTWTPEKSEKPTTFIELIFIFLS